MQDIVAIILPKTGYGQGSMSVGRREERQEFIIYATNYARYHYENDTHVVLIFEDNLYLDDLLARAKSLRIHISPLQPRSRC